MSIQFPLEFGVDRGRLASARPDQVGFAPIDAVSRGSGATRPRHHFNSIPCRAGIEIIKEN
jgi:hypothetical protein